jgi:hypothetical protein
MDANQATRIARARAVLAEQEEHSVMALAERVGKLDYWLRDIIALAAELDGAPTAARLDGCTCPAPAGSHAASCAWSARLWTPCR